VTTRLFDLYKIGVGSSSSHTMGCMQACVRRGMVAEGILPDGFKVKRRAYLLAERLREKEADGLSCDPLAPLDWITVHAMTVNEENAACGRVVPAEAHYMERLK